MDTKQIRTVAWIPERPAGWRWLLALLAAAPLMLRAQQAEVPPVTHFDKDRYQARNQTWMIAQAPDGRMYFANAAGLLRYDGLRWELFPMPQRQVARAVAAGTGGRIFTGGFAEFGYWQPDSCGGLAYHSLSEQLPYEKVHREDIWHILAAGDTVYFQSFSTLYCYDGRTVRVLEPPGNIMFLQQAGRRRIVQVLGRGLYALHADGTFEWLPGSGRFAGQTVRFILPGPSGGLVVGTALQGIYEETGGGWQAWNPSLNQYLENRELNRGLRLAGGGYAFGTIPDGVLITDAQGTLLHHLHRGNALQNNTVLSLFESRDGSLWAGLDIGIDLIHAGAPLLLYSDPAGSLGTVYAAAHHGGKLYIGSNQGLFVRSDAAGAPFRRIPGVQGQVWELQAYGGHLICGHNAGTFVVEGESARQISDATGGWSSLAWPGGPPRVVQSTYTGLVVYRLDPARGPVFSHRVTGLGDPISQLALDSAGGLWLAHPARGLYRVMLDDSLRRMTEIRRFGEAEGLPTDFRVRLIRAEGAPVIRAGGQHLRYDPASGRLRRLETSENGQSADFPGAAASLRLGEGRAELGCPDGPLRLPVSLVAGSEYAAQMPDGRVLLGLEEGYAWLSLQCPEQAQRFGPAMTGIRLADGACLPLGQPEIQLRARDNSLAFAFSMPVYTRDPDLWYRLEGLESGWTRWEGSGWKEYTRLPPGRYRFRVRAGREGPEVSQRIAVAQPWYATGWALAGYAAAALAAGWGILQLMERRLRAQQARLDRERQAQLETQRVQAEKEKLEAELAGKSRQLSAAALSLIRKNEMLAEFEAALAAAAREPADGRHVQQLYHLLSRYRSSEQDWALFEAQFDEVHNQFIKRLRQQFPDLTPGDLRLAALLKMNLSTKEIAPLLNISVRGAENKRYRLRKKMHLDTDENLSAFMIGF